MTYRQCFEKRDVAVAGEKFYCVSPAIVYPGVKTIDAKGKYMIPGLIDIHMHIEWRQHRWNFPESHFPMV